jgi:4-amino-4-deoxychorismate lyase
MSNLFVIRDGELCTPRLDACGVAGVMRSVLLDLADVLGLSARRESLLPADLRSAQEVFLCNSLIGIWPVISVSGQNNFGVGPVTRRLQQALSVQTTSVTGNWYNW